MIRCYDCGGPGGPLCSACRRVARALGHEPDERLAMLGAAPIDIAMVED